jgi:hypothetical protein
MWERERIDDVERETGGQGENNGEVGRAGGLGWCDEETGVGCDISDFRRFFIRLYKVSKYVLLLETCLVCCYCRVASGDSDSGEPRDWKREMLQNKGEEVKETWRGSEPNRGRTREKGEKNE